MKPMIFNMEMTRAILDGRKTVTRRAVKPQPHCYGPSIPYPRHEQDFELDKNVGWLRCRVCGNYPQYSRDWTEISHFWKPSYNTDDILYVRETWAAWSRTLGIPPALYYKADGNAPDGIKWRPSIHMPREAARIFLRVKDVRVERLQDITPEQIDAEGCKEYGYSVETGELMPSSPCHFSTIWNSTIKPKDHAQYSWNANPWVWVIEFERIEKFKEADVDE